MASLNTKAQVTIVDPDIRRRIDGVHVHKKRTSSGQKVRTWSLENYESSEEIDLDNGTYYLEMVPYWRQVDPLPVWVQVKNTGGVPVSVECITSEGKHGYKRLTVLKGNRSLNVPGIYNLSYLVRISTLSDLHVSYIRGISRRRGKIFESAGFLRIKDLKDQDAARLKSLVGMSPWSLARIIRSAELACDIRLDPEKFERIGHWPVKRVYNTPVPTLMRATGQPQKVVRDMMDRLGELALAIDYRYVRKVTLNMVFDY